MTRVECFRPRFHFQTGPALEADNTTELGHPKLSFALAPAEGRPSQLY